jgi:hypothetical protein
MVDALKGMLASSPKQQDVALAVALTAGPVLLYWLYQKATKNQLLKPYPPGPPGLPIFGSLFDLPNVAAGEFFDAKLLEWCVEKDDYNGLL